MLSPRELHGGLRHPCCSPDRRTEFPVEVGQILCRTWDLTMTLTAAFTAAIPPRPGDLSPETSSAVIGHYHPGLQARTRPAASHGS